MRNLGYNDAQLTAPGADEGVDVVSGLAVAQVKCEMRPIGRPALQQLLGCATAAGKRDTLFFALNGFTEQARDFAERANIALFTFDYSSEPKIANDVASRWLDERLRQIRADPRNWHQSVDCIALPERIWWAIGSISTAIENAPYGILRLQGGDENAKAFVAGLIAHQHPPARLLYGRLLARVLDGEFDSEFKDAPPLTSFRTYLVAEPETAPDDVLTRFLDEVYLHHASDGTLIPPSCVIVLLEPLRWPSRISWGRSVLELDPRPGESCVSFTEYREHLAAAATMGGSMGESHSMGRLAPTAADSRGIGFTSKTQLSD